MAVINSACKGVFVEAYTKEAHEEYELIRVIQGTGIFQTDAGQFSFAPGAIFCIKPNVMHQMIPDESFCDICSQITEPFIPGMDPVMVFHDDEEETMLHLMQMQARFFEEQAPNYENLCNSLSQAMQHLLISWLRQMKPEQDLVKLVEQMRQNISNSAFNVTEALARIPQSISYTRRQFKAVYGVSPVSYMNQLRINQAKLYLMSQRLPISEVAQNCGFDDEKYFSRLFHQLTGISPSEYHRRYRANLESKTE